MLILLLLLLPLPLPLPLRLLLLSQVLLRLLLRLIPILSQLRSSSSWISLCTLVIELLLAFGLHMPNTWLILVLKMRWLNLFLVAGGLLLKESPKVKTLLRYSFRNRLSSKIISHTSLAFSMIIQSFIAG